MQFNFSTINKLFTIFLLISHMNGLSMLNPYKEATAYNHDNKLLFFSHVAYSAFSQAVDTSKPLEEIIEPLLSLSTVCKKLTALLFPKIIRTSCQSYSIETKNAAMQKILESINNGTYRGTRETSLFLIYAGADPNHDYISLLSEAVIYNDKQMITALFKNNANPNQRRFLFNYPAFWLSKNIDIVKMFINQKANLTTNNHDYPNVLWTCIVHGHSLELIKYYLSHNIDITTKDDLNNCLLHPLVYTHHYCSDSTKHDLATLFLDTAPKIINTINSARKTPLDTAYSYLDHFKHFQSGRAICLQLIELFKNRGGKTAQELQTINKVKNTNDSLHILSLPNNVLYLIFSHYIDHIKNVKYITYPDHSLESIIEQVLSLSTVCKKLTPLLFPKIIRTSCQSYSIETKDRAMENLLNGMHDFNHWKKNKREKALFLTHAGANNNACKYYSLLKRAVQFNDKQMITILFKNNTDPNQVDYANRNPVFFYIKTPQIAQIFVDQNVNLNKPGDQHCTPNVLWACIVYEHPLELIKFYLDHKVNVTTKNIDEECLLHCLIRGLNYQCKITNYVQIATLFLGAAPEIINTINKEKMPPLDIAYQYLKKFKKLPESHAICLQLIELFKNRGGKTAQELQNMNKVENKDDSLHKNQDEEGTCCICYENANKLMLIPCTNKHHELICLNCHNTPSLELCPLCRTKLNKKL